MNVCLRNLILCLLLCCYTTSYSQTAPKLRIDLDRSYGGAFSDYLDSLEYIPLENTKNSEVGQISNLILTDSSFVVTDNDTRSVLFFSTSGKFLRRISKRGTLSAVGSMYVAPKNTIDIIFQDAAGTKVSLESYSLTGNFIAIGDIASIDKKTFHDKLAVDKDVFWLRHRFSVNGSIPEFYLSQYKNNSKVTSAVPFDTLNAFGIYHFTRELGHLSLPVVRSGKFYFATPLTHKLYEVDAVSGVAQPIFQIVFPAKFGVKSNLLAERNIKKIDSISNAKWFDDMTVLALENILYDRDKMVFKTHTGLVSRYGTNGAIITRNFLYRLKEDRLIAFEKISPDLSTYFLPFRSSGTISTEGFYFKDNHLYTHLSSLEMFAAREATKSKKPQYSPLLQSYFKLQSRKSNPVIVRMKLKQ